MPRKELVGGGVWRGRRRLRIFLVAATLAALTMVVAGSTASADYWGHGSAPPASAPVVAEG